MLTQAQLMDVLDYDPGTGEFTWLVKPSPRVAQGSRAGATSIRGCRYIKINHKSYLAHRLAWLYVYGHFPEMDLDFRNRDMLDTRIDNLREATKAQNAFNSGTRRPGKLKGAYWHKRSKRWAAAIYLRGRHLWLGFFGTEKEAHAAYCKAARKHHGEFYAG